MDTFVKEDDSKLMEKDTFTFQVLQRIMFGNCKLTLTDHKNFILCYSTPPYPVWIWTEDDLEEDIKELIWDALKHYDLLKTDIRFNVKYEFAEYLFYKAKEEKLGAKIITNMLAYECKNPIVPHIQAEGKVYRCSLKDIDELTQIIKAFHDAIGINKKDYEAYRKDAEEELKSIPVYFWKNNNGDTVATCNVRIDGDKASIGQVYTPPQHRRKHYAENVVYHATKEAFDQGYIPTLYTNADYAASNKCYQKIGFEIRGSLCMLGFER